jgi:hypothetical protein
LLPSQTALSRSIACICSTPPPGYPGPLAAKSVTGKIVRTSIRNDLLIGTLPNVNSLPGRNERRLLKPTTMAPLPLSAICRLIYAPAPRIFMAGPFTSASLRAFDPAGITIVFCQGIITHPPLGLIVTNPGGKGKQNPAHRGIPPQPRAERHVTCHRSLSSPHGCHAHSSIEGRTLSFAARQAGSRVGQRRWAYLRCRVQVARKSGVTAWARWLTRSA